MTWLLVARDLFLSGLVIVVAAQVWLAVRERR
jgi:hypothetical protein